MKRRDGARSVLARRHLDESETAGLASNPVGDDRDVFDLATLGCEQHSKLLRIAGIGKIPDVDLGGHASSLPARAFANESAFEDRSETDANQLTKPVR